MTSHIKEPFKLVNPFSAHFVPSLAFGFIVLINLIFFGFLGPALVSAPSTAIVLAGFILGFLDLLATISLGIAAINAVLNKILNK